jgi:hypothetical protein
MLRETVATLRVINFSDIAPIVPLVEPGEDVVVLVHGLLASAGAFRPLRTRLERELGVKTASFTHVPFTSIRRIASELGRIVDSMPRGARVHVVGHSLGGIVARWYVQELGGHDRVLQTISLGSPFAGAPLAARLPILVGADLHPSSELLHRIRNSVHAHKVPHLSIAGTHDRTAPVSTACAFPHGEVIEIEASHNALLFHETAMNVVLTRVARYSASTPEVPVSGVLARAR